MIKAEDSFEGKGLIVMVALVLIIVGSVTLSAVLVGGGRDLNFGAREYLAKTRGRH